MIRPRLFNGKNLLPNSEGKALHYAEFRTQICTEIRPYTLGYGESLHSLAVELFGVTGQYLWTIISDINPPRHPDDWEEDDTLYLPLTILQDDV
jgi:hypothetical protein